MKNQLLSKSILFIVITISSCACTSHKSLSQLVGNDHDEHGCLPSAGYQWSEALKDCIRIWEVGDRFDSVQKSVYLVFSKDSTYAEIFPGKQKSILCKRKKGKNVWRPKKGEEFVTIANNVITVHVENFDYTKTIEKP